MATEVSGLRAVLGDIPGQAESRREKLALGLCRTRTIAERKAAEKLGQFGINGAQTFIEATSSITFRDQGEIWLKSLSTRKRNPVEQTTIDTWRYALDHWIYPFLEGRLLADTNNRAMKELVEKTAPKLSPKSSKHISPGFRTLCVMQKAKLARFSPTSKQRTACAKLTFAWISRRCSKNMLASALGYCSELPAAQLLQSNTLRDSLHLILTKLNHVQGGFNIFRRYRITYLEKSDCPDSLKHFWSGHAQKHISERYVKLIEEREYRLEWAERIGLGFKIPTSVGLLGLLRVVPNAV